VIFSKSQKNAQINLQDTILCNFEIGSDASNFNLRKFSTINIKPMNRRDFVSNSAKAFAGSLLLSQSVFARKKAKHAVGVQLYSVRAEMKKDPMATLKKSS
jgi:hypothetical protein